MQHEVGIRTSRLVKYLAGYSIQTSAQAMYCSTESSAAMLCHTCNEGQGVMVYGTQLHVLRKANSPTV